MINFLLASNCDESEAQNHVYWNGRIVVILSCYFGWHIEIWWICIFRRKIVMQLKKHLISWAKWVGQRDGVLSPTSHVVRSVSLHKVLKFWECATQNITQIYNPMHTYMFMNICLLLWNLSYMWPCVWIICSFESNFVNQTTLRELTLLGIKNAENLAIPSVRNDVSL